MAYSKVENYYINATSATPEFIQLMAQYFFDLNAALLLLQQVEKGEIVKAVVEKRAGQVRNQQEITDSTYAEMFVNASLSLERYRANHREELPGLDQYFLLLARYGNQAAAIAGATSTLRERVM